VSKNATNIHQKPGISILAASCIIGFLTYAGFSLRTPIIPLYAVDVGASIVEVGVITSSFMIGTTSMCVVSGLFSDWLGRKRLLICGSFLGAAASFFFLPSTSPYILLLVNLLAGIGHGIYSPTMFALIGDMAKEEHLATAYGWYTTATNSCMFVAPAIGGFIAYFMGFKNLFAISAMIMSLSILMVILTIPQVQRKQSFNIHSQGKNNPMSRRFNRPIIAACIGSFCFTFAYGAPNAFLRIYGASIGLTVEIIGLIVAAAGGASAVFRIPMGMLMDRIRNRVSFLTVALGTCTVAVILAPWLESIWLLMAVMAILGVDTAIVTIAAATIIAETSGDPSRGLAMGVYWTFFYGGFGAGGAFAGLSISTLGFQGGFALTSGVAIIGIVLLNLLAKIR